MRVRGNRLAVQFSRGSSGRGLQTTGRDPARFCCRGGETSSDERESERDGPPQGNGSGPSRYERTCLRSPDRARKTADYTRNESSRILTRTTLTLHSIPRSTTRHNAQTMKIERQTVGSGFIDHGPQVRDKVDRAPMELPTHRVTHSLAHEWPTQSPTESPTESLTRHHPTTRSTGSFPGQACDAT